MTKKNILYVHGFRSSGSGDTARMIREVFPEDTVISPDFDLEDPELTAQTFYDVLDTVKVDLIIGSSLGGYWALLFAKTHGIPSLVFNPSLTPEANLAKYEVPGLCENYDALAGSFRNAMEFDAPCIVVQGSNDTVIPPATQPVELLDVCKLVETDWEHRVPDTKESRTLIKRLVDELFDAIIGCHSVEKE